jgi:cytochrome c
MSKLALAVTLGALASAAPVQAAGDPVAGEALAARLCTSCHAVAKEQSSPVPEAPPLASFAERWPLEHLEEAFAEGIMVGHSGPVRMPEFVLEPEQIDDLLAYLATLSDE